MISQISFRPFIYLLIALLIPCIASAQPDWQPQTELGCCFRDISPNGALAIQQLSQPAEFGVIVDGMTYELELPPPPAGGLPVSVDLRAVNDSGAAAAIVEVLPNVWRIAYWSHPQAVAHYLCTNPEFDDDIEIYGVDDQGRLVARCIDDVVSRNFYYSTDGGFIVGSEINPEADFTIVDVSSNGTILAEQHAAGTNHNYFFYSPEEGQNPIFLSPEFLPHSLNNNKVIVGTVSVPAIWASGVLYSYPTALGPFNTVMINNLNDVVFMNSEGQPSVDQKILAVLDGIQTFVTTDPDARLVGISDGPTVAVNVPATEQAFVYGPPFTPTTPYLRGDAANNSGHLNLADVTSIALTASGIEPIPDGLFNRYDVNADNKVNLADAISLANYLFVQGSPPPATSHLTPGRSPFLFAETP